MFNTFPMIVYVIHAVNNENTMEFVGIAASLPAVYDYLCIHYRGSEWTYSHPEESREHIIHFKSDVDIPGVKFIQALKTRVIS
jgi:hypothetical protein